MKCLVLLLALSLGSFTAARVASSRDDTKCHPDCEDTPLDLSFIVDASSSIWPQNFTIGLWFVSDFVSQFNIAPNLVRVSMLTFGDRVYERDAFDFDTFTDKRSLTTAIDAVPYRHGNATETGAAIRWYMENQRPLVRPNVRNVLVVLTDGNSQEPEVTREQADRAIADGMEIYAIGVGHNVSQEELHNIATDGKHVFVVNAYNALTDIVVRLAVDTCGGKALPKPEPLCHMAPIDISFVIDSSTSIGADNFTIQLEFIKEFLQGFEISPTAIRVAAIMFGDRVYDEAVINFGDYSTKKATLDAVLALEWMHGTSTNTGAGINYMTDNFLPDFRPSADHVGIVITDGFSQEWQKTEDAAQRARDDGITMLAVGVGKLGETISQEELERISGSGDRVLTADDFAQLNNIRGSLIELTCARNQGKK